MARIKTKLCKLSHVRETKDERRLRLDDRRMVQLALPPSRRMYVHGVPNLYRPHQGKQECARRVRQAVAS